jgi:hypothetical protein
MKKIKFSCPVIINQLEDSKYINKKLLNFFDICDSETIKIADGYEIKGDVFPDSFAKLDFYSCNDYERPWVKFFLPYLKEELKIIANSLWYDNFSFKGIWFQQYEKNNTHGWHIHAENYTGVYYVDLNHISPKTEIINPYDNKTISTMKVKTGDVLLFPSFFIHRAPPVTNDCKKTIVSFNLNFTKPSQELFLRERISYNFYDKFKKICKIL